MSYYDRKKPKNYLKGPIPIYVRITVDGVPKEICTSRQCVWGLRIRKNLNTEITFSRRKLRSVIYNFVNNSVKYKSPLRRPEIFIKTMRHEDYIIISISGNGIGIDDSKHDTILPNTIGWITTLRVRVSGYI